MGLPLEQVRQRGGVWHGGFVAQAQNPVYIMALGSSPEQASQRGVDDGGGTWI